VTNFEEEIGQVMICFRNEKGDDIEISTAHNIVNIALITIRIVSHFYTMELKLKFKQ
jgi:hypothetical protein